MGGYSQSRRSLGLSGDEVVAPVAPRNGSALGFTGCWVLANHSDVLYFLAQGSKKRGV